MHDWAPEVVRSSPRPAEAAGVHRQVASAPGPLERGLRVRAERSCPSSRASGRPGAQCPTGEIIPTRRPPAQGKTMSAEAILRTHVRPLAADVTLLGRCLDECGACEATCTICADACLAEDDVRDLVHCIRLCLDCADACAAAVRILGRQTDPHPPTQLNHAGSVSGGVPRVRRRVRTPRAPSRALPPLRGGVPTVRAGVRGAARGARGTPMRRLSPPARRPCDAPPRRGTQARGRSRPATATRRSR